MIEGGTTYYPVAAIEILILVLLAAGIVSFYRGGLFVSHDISIFYSFYLFIFYSMVVVIWTPYKLPAVQQVILFISYFILVYFCFLFCLTRRKFQEIVLSLFIMMGTFESGIGMGQYFILHQRAKGTFFNPDFYGEYLAIIFCVALGRFYTSFNKQLNRRLWPGLLVILGIGIFLSQSRGAAFAWSIGLSLVLWKRFKYGVVYGWLILILFFVVIPNPLQHRVINDYRDDPYSFSRLEMWKEAVQIIKDHPGGIGLEMFPLISPQYAFPVPGGLKQYRKIAESPHNEYLRFLTEMGIAGGLLLLYLISSFFRKWIEIRNPSLINYGILGGIVVFLVHSLFDATFNEPALILTVSVLSAFLVKKDYFHLAPIKKVKEIRGPVFYAFVASFCLGAFLIVSSPALGWYYFSKGFEQIKHHQNGLAEDNFQKAIFWKNNNAAYHSAMANAYYNAFNKTNDHELIFKAIDELDTATDLNPADGNYFKLKGMIYKMLAMRENQRTNAAKLYDEAFTNYQNALKLLPYDASVYLEIGDIHSNSHRFNEAEYVYNQAIALEPDYLLAREKKIELLIKEGKIEESAKEYQKLLSHYGQIKLRAVTDSEKAFIYFNQSKLEELMNGESRGGKNNSTLLLKPEA